MSCPSAFIVSQGGCGSTVFFDQLGYGSRCENVKNCTCVKKHVLANCLKNVTFIKNTKILYIYGNPYEQLLSVARRCFIPHLIYEYENSDYSKYVDTFKKSVFLKWHEFVNPGTNERQCVGVGLEEILSRYLEDRNAFLDFKLHYMSWRKVPLKNVSIRFIKYDEILNSGKEKICSWLDRDFDFELKKRKVNYINFKKNHPEISRKIEEKYKSWFSLYEKIPLVEDLIW
jgi:hypothetical protein